MLIPYLYLPFATKATLTIFIQLLISLKHLRCLALTKDIKIVVKRKRGKTKGSKISPTRGAQLKVFWFLPEMTIKPSKTISSLRPGYLNLLKPSYRPKSQPPSVYLAHFLPAVEFLIWRRWCHWCRWKVGKPIWCRWKPRSLMSLTTLVDIFGQFSGGANLP